MRVLLIGAAGQLGYDVNQVFKAAGHDVTGADVAGAGAAHNVDITDLGSVSSLVVDLRPDLVVNCAAFTNVDGCETHREACEAVNATGAGNVARACNMCEGAALIHMSTDYVFDGTKHEPYREDDPTAPLGQYGRTKYEGERQVAEIIPRKHLTVRTAWLFGTHGPNFVKTMLRLGRERDELSVVDDQTGSPTYSGHLASALLSLAEHHLGNTGVYHMVGGGYCTWYEFASEIFRLADVDVNVKRTTTAEFNAPAPRPAYSVLANTRAPEIAMPHWREGLIECLRGLGELHNEGYAAGGYERPGGNEQ